METNNYEQFRNMLISNLYPVISMEEIHKVLQAVDKSIDGFDVVRKSMDLITTQCIPEIVKVYIGAKAVSHRSFGTLKQYKYKLFDFFYTVKKSYVDITAMDIRKYMNYFKEQRNASDSYMESIRITLNGFFVWLVENDYLAKNPCAKIEKIHYNHKKRIPLTAYELEYCRFHTVDIREKALIDFLFSTGLRVSECADVLLSDINWNDRSVLVRHGKGDKQRIVYFNAEAEVSLREYLKTKKGNSDSLFTSMRSPYQGINAHTLEDICKKIAKRTGIHVFPHRFRHTFGTYSIRSGMRLEVLQTLMGHAKPETTLIYAKQDQTEVKVEHQRIYA